MAPDLLTTGWRKTGGLYREPHLEAAGIPHGVTSRGLGNMKDAAARRSALAEAGLAERTAFLLTQEHGTVVLEARAASAIPEARRGRSGRGQGVHPLPRSLADSPAGGSALDPARAPRGAPGAGGAPGTPREEKYPRGDGWVCADRAAVPCVYVADCLPIFIWDRRRSAVGVFHAGWRGVAAGMPRAAVRAFRRHGLTPESLLAAIGPHVGACCYAVGPEVAERFRPEVRVRSELGAKLDLGGEARMQLLESGLSPDRVAVSPECTSCLAGEFYSFRRERSDVRMLAFIALP